MSLMIHCPTSRWIARSDTLPTGRHVTNSTASAEPDLPISQNRLIEPPRGMTLGRRRPRLSRPNPAPGSGGVRPGWHAVTVPITSAIGSI